MTEQPLTLSLPEPLFLRLKDQAARTNRSVEQVTVDILATAVPVADELPPDLAGAISPLSVLDDESRWRAARTHLSAEDVGRIEELHRKRGQEGLTEEETRELAGLVRQYERAMLVRAQAAALLQQRGHDVSVLLRPA